MRAIRTSVISIFAIGLLAGSAVGVAAQDGAAVTAKTIEPTTGPNPCIPVELGKRRVRMDCVGVVIEASDERLSGTADITTYSLTDSDGDGYSEAEFGTDVVRLVNEGGAWSGQGTFWNVAFVDRAEGQAGQESMWVLTGEDGYEGLSAYLKFTDVDEEFEGVIIEGELATPPAE